MRDLSNDFLETTDMLDRDIPMNLSMYFVSMNSTQLLLVLVMCTLVGISLCLPPNHLSGTHA